MGAHTSRDDFEWSPTDEPHASRRQQILEKHPQIKTLFGHDPNTKWIVMALVLVQIASLFVLKDCSWPILLLTAYTFTGVINNALVLAVHEITHGLAFGPGKPLESRIFGYFANLPIGMPMSVTFKKYHLLHHRYQGVDGLDPDLPTTLEAKLFCTTFGKLIWLSLQGFFYAFRPLIVNPKPLNAWEWINVIVQLIFDGIVWYCFGFRMVAYLVFATIIAAGLHPLAGHYVAEHYIYKKDNETYSYYGPLNWLSFNIGYHNEHHDFPNVPGSRLPEVKRIAAEFYDDLPQHPSWLRVLYNFVTDPDMGLYSRIKREEKKNEEKTE